jgi:hypothetical protein
MTHNSKNVGKPAAAVTRKKTGQPSAACINPVEEPKTVRASAAIDVNHAYCAAA